jgi:AP2-associated kinase
MKNLFRAKKGQGALTGRTVTLDPTLSVKVDALVGEGGFASIYRVTDVNTRATFALKHFRLG